MTELASTQKTAACCPPSILTSLTLPVWTTALSHLIWTQTQREIY